MEKIINENLITNTEAKEILKERDKEIELGYDQKNSLEYLKKYDKLKKKSVKKIKEELEKVSRLRERDIIKLINILPEDLDDLRLVMKKKYTMLEDDEKKLILKTIKDNI